MSQKKGERERETLDRRQKKEKQKNNDKTDRLRNICFEMKNVMNEFLKRFERVVVGFFLLTNEWKSF